jgi:hypothetical protein
VKPTRGRFAFLSFSRLSDFRLLGLLFLLGIAVRLVPELLAFPLPIGFDTVYYAFVMKSGVVWPNWSSFFTSNWLLSALTVPLYGVSRVDPFTLLNVVAPLLYGLNVAGIFWFARKALGWSLRMSVLAGVFFAVQLASLRISWDLLDNTLGLGILLFALSYVKEVDSKRGFALFASLSLLSVFAHDFAAVTLLVAVLGLVVWRFSETRVFAESKRLILGVLPALSVFLVGVYLEFFPVHYVLSTNVIGANDIITGQQGGLFFLVNYLRVQTSVDYYASYWNLALSVGVVFAVLYLPYLFLVVKGFFRNTVLTFWTSLLLVGSFGCLVVPFAALEYWHRWMFMLVYPFTFYAVYGLSRIVPKLSEKRFSFASLFSSKKAAAMVSLTLLLGVAYLATPVLMVYANTSVSSVSGTYLYFSTSPTVPYQDVNSVIQAMGWLNESMDTNSCVLLQHAFQFWGELYLDKSHVIVTFDSDVDLAVETALVHGYGRIYFVWWNTPIGWYNVSVPSSFVGLEDFGRISVYAYGGDGVG